MLSSVISASKRLWKLTVGNAHRIDGSIELPYPVPPKILYTGLIDGTIPVGILEFENGEWAIFDIRHSGLYFGNTLEEAMRKLVERYDS